MVQYRLYDVNFIFPVVMFDINKILLPFNVNCSLFTKILSGNSYNHLLLQLTHQVMPH